MVARVPFPLAHIEKEGHAPTPRATIKALPSTPLYPRPYSSIGLLSVSIASVDAYWATLVVALNGIYPCITCGILVLSPGGSTEGAGPVPLPMPR